MADKVIWNDNKTMNFLAHEFQSARVTFPRYPADGEKHWVRVHLKGSSYNNMGELAGLWYATCSDRESAKHCLAKLTEKLIRAGVIEKPEPESGNRFDHVELQEVTS